MKIRGNLILMLNVIGGSNPAIDSGSKYKKKYKSSKTQNKKFQNRRRKNRSWVMLFGEKFHVILFYS